MPFDAGLRDRHVTIQQLTESVGSSGFPVETWSTLPGNWWASKQDGVRRTSSGEAFKNGQLSAATVTRWELGYSESMDPELVDVPKTRRLVYQGRTFDITAADHLGRRDGIALFTLSQSRVE